MAIDCWPLRISKNRSRDFWKSSGRPGVHRILSIRSFRLQNDGVWEVPGHEAIKRRRGHTDPLRSELVRLNVRAGFPEKIYRTLKGRPEIVRELARAILESHFPPSLHEAITREVGLELQRTDRNSTRDQGFREAVLSAWEHRCSFCGYNVQLDRSDLGLEAAHIRWVQAGGPDMLSNGVACCCAHHQAFDRGGISISDDYTILVSSRLLLAVTRSSLW
jgi:putative restriction endonuclease